jgi:hypothetical protein
MAGSTVILGYNGPDPYTRFNIPFLGLNGPYSRKLLFESTLGSSWPRDSTLALDYTISFFLPDTFISIPITFPTKFHLFVNHLLATLRLALVLGI